MMRFHSVIDRPEPVSRVAPPRLTISKTKPAKAKSQTRTGAMLGALRAVGLIACAMPAVIEGFERLWHAALRRSGRASYLGRAERGLACRRQLLVAMTVWQGLLSRPCVMPMGRRFSFDLRGHRRAPRSRPPCSRLIDRWRHSYLLRAALAGLAQAQRPAA